MDNFLFDNTNEFQTQWINQTIEKLNFIIDQKFDVDQHTLEWLVAIRFCTTTMYSKKKLMDIQAKKSTVDNEFKDLLIKIDKYIANCGQKGVIDCKLERFIEKGETHMIKYINWLLSSKIFLKKEYAVDIAKKEYSSFKELRDKYGSTSKDMDDRFEKLLAKYK